MAEQLQRQWDLTVLRITLDASPVSPVVECQLALNVGGVRVVRGSWSAALADFGKVGAGTVSPVLNVPPDLAIQIVGAVEALDRERNRDLIVWLQLVPPFGYLGAVPWEEALQPRLGLPILRLPDVLPGPTVSRHPIQIVVCDLSTTEKGDPKPLQITAIGTAMREVAARVPVRVHLFVRHNRRRAVRAELKNFGLDVVAHRPPRHPTLSEDEVLSAPVWLKWIRDTMRLHDVDALHLVCGSTFDPERSWLDFGEFTLRSRAPRPWAFKQEVSLQQRLTATDVLSFAQAIGTGIVTFSSPNGQATDTGLRMVADTVGARLVGAVACHSGSKDPEGHALTDAYRFLLAEPHLGIGPPASPALMLYCQPQRVGGGAAVWDAPEFDSAELVPVSFADSTPEQPAWLGVAEQFFAQQQTDILRFKTAQSSGTGSEAAHYWAGVEQALSLLKGVIEQHLDTP